jgi:hypothetical protein
VVNEQPAPLQLVYWVNTEEEELHEKAMLSILDTGFAELPLGGVDWVVDYRW